MGKPLSVDLRKRILGDVDRGLSALAVAEKYDVSRRTVNALVHHRERTGSLEPIRGRQGRKSTLEPRKQEILHAIDQNSSVTLESLRSQLGLVISLSALWRALQSWGIRLKKSRPRG
jgi:transposase